MPLLLQYGRCLMGYGLTNSLVVVLYCSECSCHCHQLPWCHVGHVIKDQHGQDGEGAPLLGGCTSSSNGSNAAGVQGPLLLL
jgi:hypothetical protein